MDYTVTATGTLAERRIFHGREVNDATKDSFFLCCLVLLWPVTIEHNNSTMACPVLNSCEDCCPTAFFLFYFCIFLKFLISLAHSSYHNSWHQQLGLCLRLQFRILLMRDVEVLICLVQAMLRDMSCCSDSLACFVFLGVT